MNNPQNVFNISEEGVHMRSSQSKNKQKTTAVLNIIAGVLFSASAFNLLTGLERIDWIWLILGLLFVGIGIWGLKKP